ncbi:hypothetical protein HRTV-25_gp28 [Halorubrum tailed virus 25]|uniref:Uncharacterized protein n=1 Tax=Halorubrum tailed virus 25 TaxID=2878006 RepID=A0AAE8XZS7_9CAUD|nr:hypothetical protein M1M37_gp028 [Halorubrum tailed virus 25]UBF22609.1 hypothetical protein HRTV-25_gp28 [Halorubrum tailed virus 25]
MTTLISPLGSGGPNDPLRDTASHQSMFAIYGLDDFAPRYVPNRFSFSKERNLDRSENFCGGEDVEDLGSKNREVHISGRIRHRELTAFHNLLDTDVPVDMISPGWSGEVRVLDGEFDGPRGRDPATNEYLYQYSLNVVSTGRDESTYRDE